MRRAGLPITIALALLGAAPPSSNVPNPRLLPRPEPVAETKLLMEGINQANFEGLEHLLDQRPKDAEAWKFARGQALLIAESANLLMLRPPKSGGKVAWLDRAAELRTSAVQLARSVAAEDFEQSRAKLAVVAASCNDCHQTFRVSIRVTAFGGRAEPDAGPPVP